MKPAPHLQLLPPLAAAAPAEADDTLGVRAREGDLGAWSEVYARHYGRLLRQLRHLTGDLAVAEELAQETFAQAMASRARYEPGRSLEAWLAGIALNMARKHWRSRQSAEKAHARLGCVAELHGSGPALDRLHLQRERSRVLQEELHLKIEEQGNNSLRVLSVLTSLLLPPTLVTGIFGMNTKGLPFTDVESGFLWAALLMGLSSLAAYFVMRRIGLIR